VSSPIHPASHHGRPEEALLPRLDWETIDARVRRQQRNREIHTPPISLFRWWARRPHALIGAILDAAQDLSGPPPVVSDPFSGGGTVAVEAARRGLDIYAQDLHPWAITGLRSALDELDADELAEAADLLLAGLRDDRARLYGTSCRDHGEGSEVLTTLWVRYVSCSSCREHVFLYPYSYVTRASRAADERWGWWGCAACGGATRSLLTTRERRCASCRRRLGDATHALLRDRRAHCPRRECGHEFDALRLPARWQVALVQRQCRAGNALAVHFDRPSDTEFQQAQVDALDTCGSLREAIPDGLETTVLHRAGFADWAALYPSRQLESLLLAARAIDALPYSARIKNRLRLALCGAAEMAGHVSRWDRYYPKAYEATANHRFAVTGLSAEVNLLADRGRGVLKRRFAASVKTARWRAEHIPSDLPIRRRSAAAARLDVSGVLLANGSSRRQLTKDASVDLVLTDPPYFDDVQYGELAALFLTWARAVGLIARSVELDLSTEAVANTRRGTGVEHYRQLLTAILRETRRSLAPRGRVIVTFHNTDIRAWWALGRALYGAELGIRALAVAQAENDADHSKRGRRGFMRDLVIESRVGLLTDEPVLAGHSSADSESRELLSAGRALATMPADESLAAFRERYRRLRGPIDHPRISPTGQERRCA
jgi:putative DNA methylase